MKHLFLAICTLLSLSIAPTALLASTASTSRVVVFELETEARAHSFPAALATDLLRKHLAHNPRLQVLERGEMARLFHDIALGERLPSVFDQRGADTLGRLLRARYSVFGNVRLAGPNTYITARLVDNSTGAILVVASEASSAPLSNLSGLLAKVAKEILVALKATTTVGEPKSPARPKHRSGSSRHGTLQVTPSPHNATIYIDTLHASSGPLIRHPLPPGVHIVKLKAPSDAWRDTVITVTIRPNTHHLLRVHLSPQFAFLTVPDYGDTILRYVDGAILSPGSHTLQVVPGHHTVTLLTPGYLPHLGSVTAQPDSIVTLPPIPVIGRMDEYTTGWSTEPGHAFVTGQHIILRHGSVLSGLDATTLRPLWRVTELDLDSDPIIAPDGRVFVIGKRTRPPHGYELTWAQKSRIFSLSPRTGSLSELDRFDSALRGAGAAGDYVGVLEQPNVIRLHNYRTGAKRLVKLGPRTADFANADVLLSVAPPAACVAVGQARTLLSAFGLNGAVRWRRYFATGVLDIAVVDGKVAVFLRDGQWELLDVLSGTRLARNAAIRRPLRLFVSQTTLFAVGDDAIQVILHPLLEPGTRIYASDFGASSFSGIAVSGKTLVVGLDGTSVGFVDHSNLRPLHRITLSDGAWEVVQATANVVLMRFADVWAAVGIPARRPLGYVQARPEAGLRVSLPSSLDFGETAVVWSPDLTDSCSISVTRSSGTKAELRLSEASYNALTGDLVVPSRFAWVDGHIGGVWSDDGLCYGVGLVPIPIGCMRDLPVIGYSADGHRCERHLSCELRDTLRFTCVATRVEVRLNVVPKEALIDVGADGLSHGTLLLPEMPEGSVVAAGLSMHGMRGQWLRTTVGRSALDTLVRLKPAIDYCYFGFGSSVSSVAAMRWAPDTSTFGQDGMVVVDGLSEIGVRHSRWGLDAWLGHEATPVDFVFIMRTGLGFNLGSALYEKGALRLGAFYESRPYELMFPPSDTINSDREARSYYGRRHWRDMSIVRFGPERYVGGYVSEEIGRGLTVDVMIGYRVASKWERRAYRLSGGVFVRDSTGDMDLHGAGRLVRVRVVGSLLSLVPKWRPSMLQAFLNAVSVRAQLTHHRGSLGTYRDHRWVGSLVVGFGARW